MEKRLLSLKNPRDLTLGGTKPKKLFTPNLNVTRNKEKVKDYILKNEDRRKNNKRDSKNKLYERQERFVQSSGIFSDGMGSDALRKARYEKIHSFREDTPTAIPIPKVKKDEWNVDSKSENKVYENIMKSNDSSGEDECDEKLPFTPLSWNEADLKEAKVPIRPKSEVKLENDEVNKLDLIGLKIETKNLPLEFQHIEKFSDYNPAIMLWKMPDSLAGKGLSDDPNVKTVFDYKLGEMLEGQIGKLRIRKSGKTEVLIGCVKYDLESSTLETAMEKIVEVTDSSGAMLNQVQRKFILNPNWEYLLKDS